MADASPTNGTLAHSLQEAQQTRRLLRAQLEIRQLQAELKENALGWGFPFVGAANPFHFNFDPAGPGVWIPQSWASRSSDRQDGTFRPFVWTEQQLEWMRSQAIWLTTKNDTAIGILTHLTNYTVKTGYRFEAVPAFPKDQTSVTLAKLVQRFIDLFADENRLSIRERDQFWRSRRDGESILRLFTRSDGMTEVRPVEPSQVVQPQGTGPEWSFGKRCKDHDVETLEAMSISYTSDPHDCEEVDADELSWLKLNTDSTVKVGLSDFYAAAEQIEEIQGLLRSLAIVARIQSSMPWIEQYEILNAESVAAKVAARRDLNRPQFPDPMTGRERSYEQWPPGKIPLVPKAKQYVEAPSAGNAPNHIQVVQACLRNLGNRWGMPEFLVSGDASNNNYASIFVSGGPWVQHVECEQDKYRWHFQEWRWKAVANACRHGRFKVNGRVYNLDEVRYLVDIVGTAPQVAISNKREEADIDHQDMERGVISKAHRRGKLGVDASKIDADLARERKAELPEPEPEATPTVEQVLALQKAYTAGEVSRDGAIANAELTLGLDRSKAAALFPLLPPKKLTPDEPKPPSGPAGGPPGLPGPPGPGGPPVPPAQPPSPPRPDNPMPEGRILEGDDHADLGDPAARAELMADVFYGAFGENALALLTAGNSDEGDDQMQDTPEGLILEGWNALDHPRGKGGRFIPKGSFEAQEAAKEAISDVLAGKEHTPEHAEKVLEHLSILTVKQLKDLHKEHGEPAPPRLRKQLVDGITKRLEASTKKPQKKAPEKPAASLKPRLARPGGGEKSHEGSVAAPAKKEPWQMTKGEHAQTMRPAPPTPDEIKAEKKKLQGQVSLALMTPQQMEDKFIAFKNRHKGDDSIADFYHRKHVEKAVASGKPVPAEVLADYPDLAPKPQPAPAAAPKAMSREQARAHIEKALGELDWAGQLSIPDLIKQTGAKPGDVHAALQDLRREGKAMFHPSLIPAEEFPNEADHALFLPSALPGSSEKGYAYVGRPGGAEPEKVRPQGVPDPGDTLAMMQVQSGLHPDSPAGQEADRLRAELTKRGTTAQSHEEVNALLGEYKGHLDRLKGGGAAKSAPKPPAAVVDAFHKLNASGNNHVSLADLHDALGHGDLAQTHAAVNELRKAGVLAGVGYEGRHGADPRIMGHAIREKGYGGGTLSDSIISHVSLRPEWKDALKQHQQGKAGQTAAPQAKPAPAKAAAPTDHMAGVKKFEADFEAFAQAARSRGDLPRNWKEVQAGAEKYVASLAQASKAQLAEVIRHLGGEPRGTQADMLKRVRDLTVGRLGAFLRAYL